MKRKKPAYGKRYSAEVKCEIVTTWRSHLVTAVPLSKAAFCKKVGITSATLDAWLAAAPLAPALTTEPVSHAQDTQPVAQSTDDDTTTLIAAIRQRQAELIALKAQLHQMIDDL